MQCKEFGSTTFSCVRGLRTMNKNQVVLTNQIEFLLSKAHWELHKHLCGLKVKRDEEGGDRGALQRWISIYQTCSFECMDRRLSAAPPPLSWPYFLAHCQPEIKGFQSSTCGTAHTIQQKSWTNLLGSICRRKAGMWVRTFYIEGEIETQSRLGCRY